MNHQAQSIGQIATLAHSLDGSYTGWTTERGNYMARINFGGSVLSVFGEPKNDYVMAYTDRKLSRVDGFSHTNHSVKIVNADELNKLEDQLEISAVSLRTLTESVNGIDYFDGFRSQLPMYVNEGSGPQEIYERLAEIEDINRKAFNKSLDMLEINIEINEAASSEEEVSDKSPAFQ